MQEKRGTCTGLQQAHQQQHLLGHPQQEGSDKGWCGCSSCTIHQRYRHHLLGCGSNKQVIMLRSVGLDVPLGGLWLQNSLSAQNRIIRSNLRNTVKYVINTIRRILRLRRMTHPCIIQTASHHALQAAFTQLKMTLSFSCQLIHTGKKKSRLFTP